MEELEKEKKQLESDLAHQRDAASGVSPWKVTTFIFGALFLTALFSTIYLVYQPVEDQVQEPEVLVATGNGIQKESLVHDSGLVYHVQIGAFSGFDLKRFGNKLEEVYMHQNDSLQRISLGRFERFSEAQEFQNELHKVNLPFAYITAYRDGEPIALMAAVRSESGE